MLFSSNATAIDIIEIMFLHDYGNYSGLHHLWFVSYILLAYIMTPLILNIVKIFEKKIIYMLLGGSTFKFTYLF